MRLAAVDIGSNTVHVLVADVIRNKLEDVAHYVEMPELGARVARTGSIGTKSRVAIRALRSVIARARKNGFDRLIAGATAAVREASDSEAFAKKAGEAIGVLPTAALLACERRLDAGGAAEGARHVGLPPNRVKALRAGVEALLLLLDWYGLAVLQISHEGLRHGMLLAFLERGEDWWG